MKLTIVDGVLKKIILARGQREVVLPEEIFIIGERVFAGRVRLSRVVLPENIVRIETAAFEGCEGLEEIVLPSRLNEIAERAFAGCGRLTEIFLPDSVKRLGRDAILNCTALSRLRLPEGLVERGCWHEYFANCHNLPEAEADWEYVVQSVKEFYHIEE